MKQGVKVIPLWVTQEGTPCARSPEGRLCGFPTLSFYGLVRSLGCFSQANYIAPFLPLTTPPFVLFLIYMNFESVGLFFFSTEIWTLLISRNPNHNCVCLWEDGLMALCQAQFLDCVYFPPYLQPRQVSHPGLESGRILGCPGSNCHSLDGSYSLAFIEVWYCREHWGVSL